MRIRSGGRSCRSSRSGGDLTAMKTAERPSTPGPPRSGSRPGPRRARGAAARAAARRSRPRCRSPVRSRRRGRTPPGRRRRSAARCARCAQAARDPGTGPQDATCQTGRRRADQRAQDRGRGVAAHRGRAATGRVVRERPRRELRRAGEPVGDALDRPERGRGVPSVVVSSAGRSEVGTSWLTSEKKLASPIPRRRGSASEDARRPVPAPEPAGRAAGRSRGSRRSRSGSGGGNGSRSGCEPRPGSRRAGSGLLPVARVAPRDDREERLRVRVLRVPTTPARALPPRCGRGT